MFTKLSINHVLSVASTISIFMAFIIISSTPQTIGFEISLYDAYSLYLWALLFFSSTCGVCILLITSSGRTKLGLWPVGLSIILLSNSIILTLPYLHGYYFFPAYDAQTHIGMIRDILSTGYVGSDNFYPLVHIFSVLLIEVTGINILALPSILIVLWSNLFILGIYCLSKIITHSQKWALFIVAFASPLLFSHLHVLIHPSTFSLFLAPLLLYFYHKVEQHKARDVVGTSCLIVLALTIILSHPITGIFVIVMLVCFSISNVLYAKVFHNNLGYSINSNGNYMIKLVIMLAAIWFLWYFSFSGIQNSVYHVYQVLISSEGTTLAEAQFGALMNTGLTPWQTFSLFINRYGSIFLYLFISLIAVILGFRGFIQKKVNHIVVAYAFQFIFALGFSAFSLFGYTGEYSVVRISRFFLMISPIIIGLMFYPYVRLELTSIHISQSMRKKIPMIFLAVVIIAAGSINLFNVFGSPSTSTENWQISKMENVGYVWFGMYHDNAFSTSVLTSGSILKRFEAFNFGSITCPEKYHANNPTHTPSHFGYTQNYSISITLNSDMYLITSERGRLATMYVQENVRSFSDVYDSNDFSRLNADPFANRLYSNNEFEVWLVYGN